MKTLLKKNILLILLCIPAMANAQFSKGDIFLGGNVTGSNSHASQPGNGNFYYNKNSTRSFSVYPTMGYFVNERFAVGGQLGFQHSVTEYTGNSLSQTNRTNGYSVGVLGRYFFPISSTFMFALTGDVYYSRNKNRVENTNAGSESESTSKAYETGLQIIPTFLFFPSSHWGFEASIGSLGYAHSQNLSNSSKQDNVTLNYGYVSLGVAYYFRKS